MKSTIAVSCIVPVYNVEEYLVEFMDSLVNQSLKNIEIICVDDASTDSSATILEEYKKRYGITILKNDTNQGAPAARNKGLKIATGEYIIFLDSDDFMHINMLEEMYTNCKMSDADMGICYIAEYDGKNIVQTGIKERNKQLITTFPIMGSSLKFDSIFQAITHSPCDKIIRRKILLDNKIEFQNLPCTNDVYYSYSSAICCSKIIYIERDLYFVRQNRRGSITSTWEGKKDFFCEAMDAIYEFMIKKEIKNICYKSFVEKTLINIYTSLMINSDSYKKETLSKLQNIYLKKWEILEAYSQKNLTAVQMQIVEIIMKNQEIIPYYEILFLCKYKQIISLLDEYHKKNKKIALWGVGKIGKIFVDVICSTQKNIDFIIDNDLEKQGQVVKGYEIKNWEAVKDEVDVILITNYAWVKDIKQQTKNTKEIMNIVSYLEIIC